MGSIVMEPDDLATYASSTYHPGENFSTICISVGQIESIGVFHGYDPLGYSLPLLLIQLSLTSLIILFSSRVLKHLGQPSMVPQILGGIILGPSFLGRIGGFTELFFPLRGFIIMDALAALGYVFYFFLIGVQIDLWILKKIEKRHIIVGVSTVALALAFSISWSFLVPAKINLEPETARSLPVIATVESALSFPMMAQYLTEQKMINSEFGRLALSCSLASNLFSLCIITSTVLMSQQAGQKLEMLKTVCSGVAVALVMLGVVRPIIMRMLKRKTKGESLTQEFIYVIFVGVLASAFVCQAIGLHMGYGPLVYGLALPAGPPLGSAVVDKLELINSWLFMPLYFLKNGLVMDIFSVDFRTFLIVQYIIAIAWVGKFIGALVSSLYCSIPYKDAILLGLVMNIQGVLELGMYRMMKLAKAIDHEAFMVMCTSMLLLVSTISPLIRYLYDPSRRYAVYNKRTLMHLGDNSELRVVACIHDQENVPSMISLLEAINPSKRSPVAIYALHLIELVGRSNPILIPHKLSRRSSSKASLSKSIVNAFRLFEESYSGVVSVHPFTAVSPYVTMHDEICTMALDKKASLIILPFHERHTTTDICMLSKTGVKTMNDNILEMAPCSIAFIVDRGLLHNSRPMLATWSSYRVAILFLGGADDREALAIGARMAGQPNISITMVRLLENGSIGSDNSMERKLDNEVVSEFRLHMAGNHQAKYIEEVAKDGIGTVSVLQSMKNNYELIIVGRRHEKKSPLILGLTGVDEETELGEVGYILASSDFSGSSSILVVQQHCIVWDAKDFTVDISQMEDEAEHLPMYRAAA